MKIEQDDPRLTAYALGELDDAEGIELERALADDSAAQGIVHEIQRAAEVSREALRGGAQEALLETQRQAILQTADEGARRRAGVKKTRLSNLRIGLGIGVAAAVLFSVAHFVPGLHRDFLTLASQQGTNYARNLTLPNSTVPATESNEAAASPQSPIPASQLPTQTADQLKRQRVNELLALGQQHLDTKDFRRAADYFDQSLLISPDNRRAKDGLHDAKIGLYKQDASHTEKKTAEEGSLVIKDIESREQIPTGAGSPGLKPHSMSAAAPNGVDNAGGTTRAKRQEEAGHTLAFGGTGIGGLNSATGSATPTSSSTMDLKTVEQLSRPQLGSTTGFGEIHKEGGAPSTNRLALNGNEWGYKDSRGANDVDLYQAYIPSKNEGVESKRAVAETLAEIARREREPGSKMSLLYTYDINGDGVADAVPFYTYPGNAQPFGLNRDYSRIVGAESYPVVAESGFQSPLQAPLSTFSIDVDSASYTNVRRFLTQGNLPPKEAVRIEELLNYFDYEYAGPTGADPIAVHAEIAACPWAPDHRLARVALKAKDVPMSDRPAGNFVFVIDVSGSMADANKLPLLKESMKLLVRKLNARDRVGIVTYRDSANVALASMPCDDKNTILATIDSLHADGSTNGEGGIQLGYTVANANLIPGGVNRVLLATDGDFNVGVTENDALVQMIKERAKSNIFLTVLGFGSGNIKDDRLEALADKGHGHYIYVDNFNEANRVLGEQTGATLITVAKDVKVQVEFNPAKVNMYRLIGYDDRRMAAQDFNDDRKDAGEMGAGHAVTALYEIVPAGVAYSGPGLDPLKYQQVQSDQYKAETPATPASSEMLTIKVRYKEPNADVSKRIDAPVNDQGQTYDQSSRDYRWAAAVAEYGMVLRESKFKGSSTIDSARAHAEAANGYDPRGQRAEFINLLVTAKTLLQK